MGCFAESTRKHADEEAFLGGPTQQLLGDIRPFVLSLSSGGSFKYL